MSASGQKMGYRPAFCIEDFGMRFRLMVTVFTGLKHQKEKRSMEHFAGSDVSVNETSVCVVDGQAGVPPHGGMMSLAGRQNASSRRPSGIKVYFWG
jgi:hypothetical protein